MRSPLARIRRDPDPAQPSDAAGSATPVPAEAGAAPVGPDAETRPGGDQPTAVHVMVAGLEPEGSGEPVGGSVAGTPPEGPGGRTGGSVAGAPPEGPGGRTGGSVADQATAAFPPSPAAAPAVLVPASAEEPTATFTPSTAEPAGLDPEEQVPAAVIPSFRDRGRLRRRLRYLRRVRELGFRDLGGLVFDLHRFGREGAALTGAKLGALEAVDRELRSLEIALDDRRAFTELREPGIAACPRCAALHGSDAHFCPSCGLRLSGPLAVAEVGVGSPSAPIPSAATDGALVEVQVVSAAEAGSAAVSSGLARPASPQDPPAPDAPPAA